MKIKDEIAACGMTAVLWDEIVSKYGEDNEDDRKKQKVSKYEICMELFHRLEHSCPCCEFAKSNSPKEINKKCVTGVDCHKCPMKDFWSKDRNKSGYNCENEDSPYKNWQYVNLILHKKYASEIVTIAMNAMEYWKAMKSMNITW